ncbi:hypothetical protein G6F22_018628 [Rhizopus arrhizus]|nr:hypothetical protein G6F22_018628 [Rhizopus arrhizus]
MISATERLHLVRPAAAQLDGLAHLRGRDLLAAADDGVTDGAPEGVRRLVERVEELAAPHGTGQRVARHHGLAVAFTGIDAAQQMRRLQRGQTPAVLGRQCACDAGAIARHADAVDRSQPPFVDLRLPTVQRVVPAVFHAHRARQVHVRDHALRTLCSLSSPSASSDVTPLTMGTAALTARSSFSPLPR